MTTITIDLSDLTEFAAELDAVPGIVADESGKTTRQAVDVFEQLVVGFTPVGATSALQSGTSTNVYGVGANVYGEVTNPVRYGLPVEYGRKPGKRPPRDAIELWVVRKLGLRGAEARSAAFLIARAIGRRGTKGAFMFQKGFDQGKPIVLRLYDDLPDRVVRRILQ